MADNITYSGTGATVPTNTVQRTDDLGAAGHVPYVKVMDGTDNSSTPLKVSSAGAAFVGGSVAHDDVDAGNPVKLGAKAIAHGSNPTAVAAGDRTDVYANRHGILFTIGGHPNIITLEYATTGAQTNTAIVTVSAGTRIVVTQAQVIAANANTAFPQVRVGFGTSTTPTTTGVILTHPGVPAGGGISRGDGGAIIGIGADDEDVRITCDAPTGGSLRVMLSYWTMPS